MLLLAKDNKEITTNFGNISIYQVEWSDIFSVEIFPSGQSDESFQSAEFNNFVTLEDVINNKVNIENFPSNLTSKQLKLINKRVRKSIIELVKTVIE